MLSMKNKALLITSIFLLQVIFFAAPAYAAPDASAFLVQPSATNSIMNTRAYININGNGKLNSTYGVSSGIGTESDPYVIENFIIDSFYYNPILIQNTDKYLVIRNCAIYTGQRATGIYISNCTNVRVENCIIYDTTNGIYLTNSNKVNITGCTIYGSDDDGIEVYKTNNTIISNCVLFNNTYGIIVGSNCLNARISECRLYHNWYAIGISSSNAVVEGCTISGETTYGIWANGVSGLSISDCDIGYAYSGIDLEWVNSSTVTRCFVHHSENRGITLFHDNTIAIANCDISNNEVGIWSGYDTGVTISNCNLQYDVSYGIQVYQPIDPYKITATNCYWGSSSGPGNDGSGPRDSVSSGVNTSPYLSSSQTTGHRSASDITAPDVSLAVPFYGSTMNGQTFQVGVNYLDNMGVNAGSVTLKIDNAVVSPSTKTSSAVRYTATLSQGLHNATVSVSDTAANSRSVTWFFYINTDLATPIRIFGNDDLNAGHGVISGTGTQSDPFVIQNRAINGQQGHGVTILNTDKYVVVRGCSISGGGLTGYGLHLFNVTNLLVDNLSITGNYFGIYADNVVNSTLNGCNIFDNDNSEVESKFSGTNNWFMISNCVISGSKESFERGMQLMNSPYTVVNCTFYDCYFAIHQQGGSKNQFINCTFYNNHECIMMYSTNNTISGCIFYNNSIGLGGVSSSTITGCLFDSNYNGFGSISGSTVTYCTFYNNVIGINEVGAGNEVHQCNFFPYSRSYAISAYSASINATYCWWGSNTGPEVYGSSSTGTGDTITTNVLYNPWLNGPVNLNYPTMQPTVESKNGTAGSTQTFTFNLRNNAASSKTIYLAPVLPNGWSGSVNQASITLSANQTGQVTLSATSPSNAGNGFYPVGIRSSDTSGGFTTSIGASLYGIGGSSSGPKPAPSITISQSSKSGTAGTQQSYTFTINNNDVSSASFLVSISAPNGWTASAGTPITVPAGGSTSGTAYVTSPSSAAQASYTITITVTNSGDSSNTASSTMTYTVTPNGTQPSTDGGFPFWIIIVIALAVTAAAVAFLIIKKKNDKARLAPQPPSYYHPSPPPPPRQSSAAKGGYTCPKCGALNEAGAKFCYRCGNRQ